MRLSPISALVPKLLDFGTSSDVRQLAPGTVIQAVGTDYDTTANVPNWGMCELMYVSSVQAAALVPGKVVVLDKNYRIALTAAAATEAGTGKPVFVTLTHFAVGSTTEQYGWVMKSGVCPVTYSVAATTGAVHAGTAGNWTPTASAGSGIQVLGATCIIAAAGSFTRTGKTRTGSSRVEFANVAGMFVGQAISGTGIPGASVISAIDADGRGVIIGSAVGTPVTATASGSVTVTLTHTGFGIVQMDSPRMQGYIV